MKKIALVCALTFVCSHPLALAQETPAPSIPAAPNKDHIQMHQQMAQAHQKAADCLTSGKPESECRTEFHAACEKTGGPEKCGSGMKPRRMRK